MNDSYISYQLDLELARSLGGTGSIEAVTYDLCALQKRAHQNLEGPLAVGSGEEGLPGKGKDPATFGNITA